MTGIYQQHDAAFSNVSAYAVLKNGEVVAKIAFKFPRDGAGRLYAYVHWLGSPMVRGYANGYGYDKRSAAVASAIDKKAMAKDQDPLSPEKDAEVLFMRTLATDGGEYFDNKLRSAGFDCVQIV